MSACRTLSLTALLLISVVHWSQLSYGQDRVTKPNLTTFSLMERDSLGAITKDFLFTTHNIFNNDLTNHDIESNSSTTYNFYTNGKLKYSKASPNSRLKTSTYRRYLLGLYIRGRHRGTPYKRRKVTNRWRQNNIRKTLITNYPQYHHKSIIKRATPTRKYDWIKYRHRGQTVLILPTYDSTNRLISSKPLSLNSIHFRPKKRIMRHTMHFYKKTFEYPDSGQSICYAHLRNGDTLSKTVTLKTGNGQITTSYNYQTKTTRIETTENIYFKNEE